jgi:hypothetical protein
MISGHYTIIGRTGSGKSIAAARHLEEWYKANPTGSVVIINPKASALWGLYIKPVNPGKPIKFRAGDLINFPALPHQKVSVNLLLWDVYAKAIEGTKTLVILDEGQNYTDTAYPSAAALWTQGREKGIEVVTCCQRPSRISISAITQANFLRIYNVIGVDDLKTLDGYMDTPITQYISPGKMKNGELIDGKKLPLYHSALYDVAKGSLAIEPPLPLKRPVPLVPPKPRFRVRYALAGALIASLFVI